MQLKVSVEATDVYLFPSRRTTTAAIASSSSSLVSTSSSAIIYAACELVVPAHPAAPRRLKSLSLSLLGNETLSFPSGRIETNPTIHVEKPIDEALDLSPAGLQPGHTYRFERSFPVDHTTAPYQRSQWGCHAIKVVAKATFHSVFGNSLIAQKPVFLIDCSADTGNEMLWYDKSIRSLGDDIGPFILDTRSQLFSVGGYLRVSFELLGPKPGLRPVAIRASIEQRCTLRSRTSRNGHTEHAVPERIRFLEVDGDEMRKLITSKQHQRATTDGGGPFEFETLVRLPNDIEVRPSTADGNDAAIRFRHSVEFELDYVDGEPCTDGKKGDLVRGVDGQRVKSFRVAWPVVLNSCVCRWGSMTLPPYESVGPFGQEDLSPGECGHQQQRQDVRPQQQRQRYPFPCTCVETLQTMLDFEEQVLREQACCNLQPDSGFGERPERWQSQNKSQASRLPSYSMER